MPNCIPKNLPQRGIAQLIYLINAILKQQFFLNQWKNALIIPTHKNKKKNRHQKLPPHISAQHHGQSNGKNIHRRVLHVEVKNYIIAPEQFRFHVGHSTAMQIVRI